MTEANTEEVEKLEPRVTRRLRNTERQRNAAVLALVVLLLVLSAIIIATSGNGGEGTHADATTAAVVTTIKDASELADEKRKAENKLFAEKKKARNAGVDCAIERLMVKHPRTGLPQMIEVGVDHKLAELSGKHEAREHAKEEHDILMATIDACKDR